MIEMTHTRGRFYHNVIYIHLHECFYKVMKYRNMLKYSNPAAESTSISAVGMGYSSLGVAALRSRKSMHTLNEPFFLITGTILAIHSTYLVVRINLQRKSLSTSVLIFE